MHCIFSPTCPCAQVFVNSGYISISILNSSNSSVKCPHYYGIEALPGLPHLFSTLPPTLYLIYRGSLVKISSH